MCLACLLQSCLLAAAAAATAWTEYKSVNGNSVSWNRMNKKRTAAATAVYVEPDSFSFSN